MDSFRVLCRNTNYLNVNGNFHVLFKYLIANFEGQYL